MPRWWWCFIGYKDHLNVCEESPLIFNAEMVGGEINNEPIYLCSFYQPSDGYVHPITQLSESLHKLCSNQVIPPTILLAEDFNFPGIQWREGCGQISVNPPYGLEINHSLVDTINDNNLEQLVGEPTRGANILDLLFSSHPGFISNIQIIPGISDHLAVAFSLDINARIPVKPLQHPSYLFDKANLSALKSDLLYSKNSFLH